MKTRQKTKRKKRKWSLLKLKTLKNVELVNDFYKKFICLQTLCKMKSGYLFQIKSRVIKELIKH